MDFRRSMQAVIPGVSGRIIAVLVEASGEMSLSTIARLAGASLAQTSRLLPRLVELGMVERREVPPSSLFRLVPEHVAVRPLMELSRAREMLFSDMQEAATRMAVAPQSVVVFGSLARGEASGGSDIDVLLVRPGAVAEDDPGWEAAVAGWTDRVRRVSGNQVEILEVGADECAERLAGSGQVWQDLRRDGIVVFGASLRALGAGVLG